MTKEELEKEAYKEAEKIKECQTEPNNEYEKGFNNGEVRGYKDGYRDGAEPREKRIAELEKICKDLSDKFDYQVKRVMKLEKENAELKEQCSILADCNTCVSDCKTENIEIKTQFTKAKVVLRNVIDYLGQFCSDYPDCVIEAELFLKDSGVEK